MIIKRKQIEKEYSLVSDLYHSGIKRTKKKYIGRARVKVANALQKSIEKDNDKIMKINDIMKNSNKTRRQEINDGLLKKINELDTALVDSEFLFNTAKQAKERTGKSLGMAATNEAQKIKQLEENSYFVKNIGSHKNAILVGPEKNTYMAFPHELGHIVQGEKTGGESFKKAAEAKARIFKNKKDGKPIRVIKDSKIVLKDEKAANKNGIKILKDCGATNDELRETKKEMKEAFKTYKLGRNADTKISIQSKFELPFWKKRGGTEERWKRDAKFGRKH